MHLCAGGAGVDVRNPRLEVAHGAERLVDVPREDRRRQPEPDSVGDPDRLVEVTHLDERGRRAEDLLLRDAHAGRYVTEYRRAIEETLAEVAFGGDLASCQELRSLVLADLRVRVDLLDRGLV